MTCRIRKGINIWSFDQNMPIGDCMRLAKAAGFEGIELALSAGGPLGLKTPDDEIIALRRQADEAGIVINSLATGLYWQYSLTSNRPEIREQARAIVRRQLAVGRLLGVDCSLVVPGTVGVDFRPEEVVPDAAALSFFAGSEIIPYDVAYERSCSALRQLAGDAEALGVAIGIENI